MRRGGGFLGPVFLHAVEHGFEEIEIITDGYVVEPALLPTPTWLRITFVLVGDGRLTTTPEEFLRKTFPDATVRIGGREV
jgi:hypothetical protein